MMKKFFSMLTFVLFICSTFFTGCMSRKEEKNLEKKQEEAINYFETKYQLSDIQIDSCGYLSYYDGLLAMENTNNMYFHMNDGSTVIYFGDDNYFADNKQSEEIKEALLDEFWYPALEQLKNDTPAEDVVPDDVFFNQYTLDDYHEELFTNYFSGDIKDFIDKEEIWLECDDIFLLCEPDSAYRFAMDTFSKNLTQTFSICAPVDITAASPEVVNTYLYNDGAFPDFYEDGCYLKYSINNDGIDKYEAHYIQLLPGIYVTSIEPNLILEEGDIMLGKSYTEEELQGFIDANYNALPDEAPENKDGAYLEYDKAHVDRCIIHTDTLAYQLVFSDKVKSFADQNGISCYFRFVPEEVPDSNSDFYYFPSGNDNWNCHSICAQDSPLGFNSLEEENYYFIGTQEFWEN